MTIINQASELVSVDLLHPHPQNPRRGDLPAIKRLIEQNGFIGFVVAQRRTGFVLVGNHRFQAAKALGYTEVPVIWLDVPDDEAVRIMLNDNWTTDAASYDEPQLRSLLESFDTLDGTGWDGDSMAALKASYDIFTPSTEPTATARVITEDDIRESEAKLRQKFEPKEPKIRTITCPNCHGDFDISA